MGGGQRRRRPRCTRSFPRHPPVDAAALPGTPIARDGDGSADRMPMLPVVASVRKTVDRITVCAAMLPVAFGMADAIFALIAGGPAGSSRAKLSQVDRSAADIGPGAPSGRADESRRATSACGT